MQKLYDIDDDYNLVNPAISYVSEDCKFSIW